MWGGCEMQCNCREKIEKQICRKFEEDNPGAVNVYVQMDGYTFNISQKLTMLPANKCHITYEFPTKKTGEYKSRKKIVLMSGNYCMFCGKPVKPIVDDKEKQSPS